MRLVSVTIENFRSIRNARKIPIGQITTLIGPNNEGKSNILRALYIAMSALTGIEGYRPRHRFIGGMFAPARRRSPALGQYSWETDFPLNLQKRNPSGCSVITMEFEFTGAEVDEFFNDVGSSLNGNLPIQLKFGAKEFGSAISKQGRGHKTLNQKKDKIISFIVSRINIQYIPAVRTAEHVNNIVNNLIERELAIIEQDKEFLDAIAKIEKMQVPIFQALSESMDGTIKKFIPTLRRVGIQTTQERQISALRSTAEIIIDDGVATPIQFKGDGVQSLVALAMMRHSSTARSSGRETVIALEEPESHLHPKAMHELRKVLDELATSNQIIISTHNPVFVNRKDINSNISVNKNHAYSARDIENIRSILGVHVSDNLIGAELILVVEGEEDKIALESILGGISPELLLAINDHRLVVDPMGGAGNLRYKVGMHKSNICKLHVFLDNDSAAKTAYEKCLHDGSLLYSELNTTICEGLDESELEDLYKREIVEDILAAEGIDIRRSRKKKAKWSDRVRSACEVSGKPCSDAVLKRLKSKIATYVAEVGSSALHDAKRHPVDALRADLEEKLG